MIRIERVCKEVKTMEVNGGSSSEVNNEKLHKNGLLILRRSSLSSWLNSQAVSIAQSVVSRASRIMLRGLTKRLSIKYTDLYHDFFQVRSCAASSA